MAYYPYAPQLGGRYVLQSPSGVRCVFNDPIDPDYVGQLSDVTGLDSAEVREVADDLVQQDGGQHGDFWLGRRPISLSGLIYNHNSIRERDLKVDKLLRASMALRGDATLTWQPNPREENWIENPKAAVDERGYWTPTAGAVIARNTIAAGGMPGGFDTGIRLSGTVAGTAVAFSAGRIGGTNGLTGGFPVIPGERYSVYGNMRLVDKTSGNVTTLRLPIYWYKANGTTAATGTSSIAAAQTNPVVGTDYTLSGTVTPPADAVWGVLRPYAVITNPSTFTIDVSGLVLRRGSAPAAYFDGDTPGYYWAGEANASPSADYLEMFVPVRRQQPTRVTGAWNKEFQLQLVSEWATLFGSVQQSKTGNGTVENRGSYPSAPKFRVTGPSTNPQVAVTGVGTGVMKTTGLTIAGGGWVEFDMATHTAVSSDGTNYSGNFNFAAIDTWPILNTGNNTVTLTGGGTLLTTWRDTWA